MKNYGYKIFSLLFFLFSLQAYAQKYQGLLWEISGNGLTKPSYLYGTMHVSDKVAFHLGDSFYLALKNVDVVALETNPENWQEDFTRSNYYKGSSNFSNTSNDPLTTSDFRIYEYERILKIALNKDPQMVNGMLYRTYNEKVDFEENTFLDMYIFQTGKKYGKVLTGVEDFDATEKLVDEAYEDMANDKNKRKYKNDLGKDTYTASNDAYRRGDLDMIDSINKIDFLSDAFLEKFLYIRNNNMVHSIDSIVKRSTLFVGVGCAHLPGNRGVITQLRKMGYSMRPVFMGERNSTEKDKVDKKIIHLDFNTQFTTDSLIQVELPGKLYHFPDYDGFDQHQFADMINGAFYLVTRVKTYASLRGQDEKYVLKKLDSLLYENIPGKILKKKTVRKNGYNGYDITTKTRRGDMNRYQIFITPLEVIIFKMGGNGEFINGEEGEKFFNSIQIKKPADAGTLNGYNPLKASVSVDFPVKPIDLYTFSKDTRFGENFISADENGNTYLVMKKTFHNYSYFEEDSSELNTMEEGFISSFPDQLYELKRSYSISNNYPAMDVWYRNYDSSSMHLRFLKRGVNYYLLASRYKNKEKRSDDFFESFKFNALNYDDFKSYSDTSLYYTVITPDPPLEEHKSYDSYSTGNMHKNDPFYEESRNKIFEDKNTGEKILVNYYRYKKFDNYKDTFAFFKRIESNFNKDNFIIKKKKIDVSKPVFRAEFLFSDTNSMMNVQRLCILKGKVLYTITTLYDTINGPGEFIKNFFSSFTPADTTLGMPLFAPVADTLFKYYYSGDSLSVAQAKESIYEVVYFDDDIKKLIAGINSVKAGDDYLKIKIRFVNELGYLKNYNQIIPFIKEQYIKCGDTATLQLACLKVLARLKTEESILAFKELILKETPLSNDANDILDIFHLLDDSLNLAKKLYPDLLNLASLDEYKYKVYGLMSMLLDSGYISSDIYAFVYKQLLTDARAEQKRNISKEDSKNKNYASYGNQGYYKNTRLEDFTVLLIPYQNKDQNVKQFLDKLMLSPVSELKLNLVILLLKNNRYISDTILDTIASIDLLRNKLYKGLLRIKKEKMFPSKYLSQEKMARSNLFTTGSYYSKPDTCVFIKSQKTEFKFKTGVIYFYKYKANKKDDEWKIGIVGLQPTDDKAFDFEDQLTSLTGIEINENKSLDTQLNQALRNVKKIRKHKSGGYGNYNSYYGYGEN